MRSMTMLSTKITIVPSNYKIIVDNKVSSGQYTSISDIIILLYITTKKEAYTAR